MYEGEADGLALLVGAEKVLRLGRLLSLGRELGPELGLIEFDGL